MGSDLKTDVALLKIEAKGLPVAVIGDSSKLSPGDGVAAIGAPFGFHGSVTTGVASAKERFIAGAGEGPLHPDRRRHQPGQFWKPKDDLSVKVNFANGAVAVGPFPSQLAQFSVGANNAA